MTDRANRRAADDTPMPDETLRAAFRDLHGARLHGFALLLTLGDGSRAAGLAADALAAGIARLDELRHPERAAAWLRRRVLERDGASGAAPDGGTVPALLELGADGPVMAALAALRPSERAALIASTIERLDLRDVGTIIGRDGPATDRVVRRARSRYLDAYAAAPDAAPGSGPIVTRIGDAARAAMA